MTEEKKPNHMDRALAATEIAIPVIFKFVLDFFRALPARLTANASSIAIFIWIIACIFGVAAGRTIGIMIYLNDPSLTASYNDDIIVQALREVHRDRALATGAFVGGLSGLVVAALTSAPLTLIVLQLHAITRALAPPAAEPKRESGELRADISLKG